jgi:bla regulator protein blaR1
VARMQFKRSVNRIGSRRGPLHVATGIGAMAGLMLGGIFTSPSIRAQTSSAADWEAAAGGKMAFDAASVKRFVAGSSAGPPNVPLSSDNTFIPTGGLFRAANIPLTTLIAFAYELDLSRTLILATQVSNSADLKWVLGYRWDIEARAAGNPTKDQYRLMMQSLLADRFKLVVHTETQQLPVYAVELERPGKLGPQLQARGADNPCTDTTDTQPATAQPAPGCGTYRFTSPNPGRTRVTGKAVAIGVVANLLGVNADEKRPVIDRTGLSGTFDFSLEWAPQFNGPLPPGYPEPDRTAPTLADAVSQQLGLRMERAAGPVDVLVLDSVEQPTAN